MKPNTWQIGNVNITQVIETIDGKDIQDGIPDATKENVLKIPWLKPQFIDNNGNFKAQVSSYILQSGELIVVIDTGVGNKKTRKSFPEWNGLQTDFLERFEKVIPDRNKVNYVFCSHLHFDHVGWNTVLVDGKWIPTFPKSRYLLVDKEFDYWKSFPSKEIEDDHEGIKDSVLPVYETGLVDLIPSDYRISEEISLIPTPGHTPGHSSILIKSKGEQTLITGDVLHHPCQFVYPEWETTFDTDKEKARVSRMDLLKRFADTDTLIVGSHFASPTAGRIIRSGESFIFEL